MRVSHPGHAALLTLGLAIAGDSSGSPAASPPASWPLDAFLPLTRERIAALPAADQPVWRRYLEASDARARLLPEGPHRDDPPPGLISAPPKGGRHTKGLRPEAPLEWYGSDEARRVADRVVEWQTAAGGWTKGIDYTRPRSGDSEAAQLDAWSRGTLDNDATTAELRFLGKVVEATELVEAGDGARARRWRDALERGLDYLLAAQYPNGGFPQIYPLAGGYHDAITYNDSAMVHGLEVLQAAAGGRSGFANMARSRSAEAARALERGVACILATQVEAPGGRRTGWGQQHDALTLRPCAARSFEPVALSAFESAAVVAFLMSLETASPALVRAVDDAVLWFSRVALPQATWNRVATSGSGLVTRSGAPLLWARLYEVGSDRPIFGDRDRTIHYAVTELSAERRLGYQWYGHWPQGVLDSYRSWRRRR